MDSQEVVFFSKKISEKKKMIDLNFLGPHDLDSDPGHFSLLLRSMIAAPGFFSIALLPVALCCIKSKRSGWNGRRIQNPVL